jgi:hypothetical protein
VNVEEAEKELVLDVQVFKAKANSSKNEYDNQD